MFSFVALLAVVGLEAPVLASYSQQNINIFTEDCLKGSSKRGSLVSVLSRKIERPIGSFSQRESISSEKLLIFCWEYEANTGASKPTTVNKAMNENKECFTLFFNSTPRSILGSLLY